ncbi:hypothetical protein SCHPADRAFT_217011 [Schizopora paradoxa]|uniref:Protein FAF1 n=1 Tax=Schizopora paradoxa TaxID=27342 RepID=A0A0H2RWB0_9AGAM|nr:hypothetical protein SCHPADRAFT_217011 [Schizopora paradoxa]
MNLTTMTSTKQHDEAALLAILQAHGQQFAEAFGDTSFVQGSSKKRKLDPETELKPDEDTDSESDDEWEGFSNDDDSVGNSEEGEEIDNDEFSSETVVRVKQPETIVFGEPRSTNVSGRMSKQQVKAFMSSKVTKLRHDDVARNPSSVEVGDDDEEQEEEERTNLQNDALLHKLIHTQLLSARSSDASLKPAERKRVVQGRILELAAGAKLGSGEKSVKLEEQKRASKKIRLGLERKASEREAQTLEQAKNLGNYHSSIKHLFGAQSKGQPDRRKRDKGLKMGVGRFAGGVLKLSKKDFSSEAGHSRSKARKGNGKGKR